MSWFALCSEEATARLRALDVEDTEVSAERLVIHKKYWWDAESAAQPILLEQLSAPAEQGSAVPTLFRTVLRERELRIKKGIWSPAKEAPRRWVFELSDVSPEDENCSTTIQVGYPQVQGVAVIIAADQAKSLEPAKAALSYLLGRTGLDINPVRLFTANNATSERLLENSQICTLMCKVLADPEFVELACKFLFLSLQLDAALPDSIYDRLMGSVALTSLLCHKAFHEVLYISRYTELC